MARRLLVEIVGDSRQYEKSLDRATRKSKEFNNDLDKTFRGALAASGAFGGLGRSLAFASTAFLGGAGVTFAMKSTIAAASNLNESINAVQVTFGRASEKVEAFARVADRKAGLSIRQLNELVTPLGASLQNYGFSADKAATESVKLAQRAADMASVFNTDVSQALEAIQSALRGESDPIERFGVGLNEAAVNAEVLRLGLAKTTGQITAQDKTVARLSLIYKQTAKFAGDFERTSGGAANQQRILRARIENLQAEIGQKLLPKYNTLLSLTNDLIDGSDKLGDAFHRLSQGSTINLPANVTIDQLQKIRDQFAKTFGEGNLQVQALDKALAKMNSTLFHSLDVLESIRGARGLDSGGGSGGGRGAGGIDLRETTLPFGIRFEQAQGRDLAAARDIAAFIGPVIASLNAAIASGRLHGKRLAVARKRLLEATALQTGAEETIAAAQQAAADKRKAVADKEREALKKHADEVKAAAEKQKQAAEVAAQKIRQATDQARQEIGTLFQGPVLAPTDAMRKARLGVPTGGNPLSLLDDIRAQTAQALRFERDLRRLGRLGVGRQTIGELRGLGTGAIPQLEAILGAPAGTRRQLISALASRERAAQRIGQMIVHTPAVHINAARVTVGRGGGSKHQPRSGRFAGVPE